MYDSTMPPQTTRPGSMRNLFSSWFVYGGRIGRRRYWFLSIVYALAFAVGASALIAAAIVMEPASSFVLMLVFCAIFMVFIGALSVATWSVAVRRLHDRGKTGHWLLLYYLVPTMTAGNIRLTAEGMVALAVTVGIVGWALVDLGMLRGEAGANAFGPDPSAEMASEDK